MTINNFFFKKTPNVLEPQCPGDSTPELIERLLSEDVEVKLRREFDGKRPWPKKVKQVTLVSEKPKLFFNTQKKDLSKESIQSDIGKMIQHIPAYTITTKTGDVVVSVATTSQDIMPDPYTKKPVPQPKKRERKPLLLFFMSKNEARMYINKIFNDEPEISEDLGIKITRTTLETFYKLNREENCEVDARLIADLEESQLMLSTRRKNELYTVNPKQRYKRNFFQGTPIYILKHSVGPCTDGAQFTLRGRQIYFKWKDAENSWKESFESEYMQKNIRPSIEVYNLENLLQEMEEDDDEDFSAYSFMPPKTENEKEHEATLEEIKKAHRYPAIEVLRFQIKHKLGNLKKLGTKALYSLTPTILPPEEKTWV